MSVDGLQPAPGICGCVTITGMAVQEKLDELQALGCEGAGQNPS